VCVCALAVITESGSIALLGGAQVSPDWGVPVLLCVYLCVCVYVCVCVCVLAVVTESGSIASPDV